MERALEHDLIVSIGDNILSPLGIGTEETYHAVNAGYSALQQYEGLWGIPEPFIASLLDHKAIARMLDDRFPTKSFAAYTSFERMAILSAAYALEQADVDPVSERVVFFLSTTKGNVGLLDKENSCREEISLGYSARQICGFFRNPNAPVVVTNACTSGSCAQIAAMRALQSGRCDTAVVIGADVQSKFIVSGFQSFKALSSDPCRPFDKSRSGLNLGEAAATIVYSRRRPKDVHADDWVLCRGAIRNDANHISGPSRTGEGSYLALQAVLQDDCPIDRLAFVNTHGTATPYNDEMEAIAIDRAGLLSVPVNGLKGYFGHTMGAAGVLESILSMQAAANHTIPGTRGYSECGVSRPLQLSASHQVTGRRSFVKLLSGFGGCNAALLFRQGDELC